MNFFKLSNITLPSLIAITIDPKSSFNKIIYPDSFATAEPLPIAIPTLEAFNAGASLTPSPVIATTWPIALSSRTISYFYVGYVLANTIY